MQDSLIIVLVVLVTWAAAMVVAAMVLRRRLHRGNRVTRGQPSPTPIHWRWSPGASARLHRRLQTAVWPVDPAGTEWSLPPAAGTDALRADLVEAAVRLDARLAEIRSAPRRTRAREVRSLGRSVRVVEQLAVRLPDHDATTPVIPSLPPGPLPLDGELRELSERLARLQAGRAEVAALEERAG